MSETNQAPPSTPTAGPDQERSLAMWAHLGGGILDLLCLTSFVAWVPPLIIYLSNKDKSRFVAFHALQALIFQGAVAIINFVLFIPGMLGLFILTTPLALLVNVGAFVYALMTGLKAKEGAWAEYVFVGEYARGKHGPEGGTPA